MYIDNPKNPRQQNEKGNKNLGAKVYLYQPQPKKQKTRAIKNVYKRQSGRRGR